MPKLSLLLAAATALLTACNQSPTDKAADAVARSGRDRAQAIQAQATDQAKTLDQQAAALTAQARQSGGYTAERLKVRADALSKEARIIRKQGKGQAESTQEAADAQAKGMRSQ